MEKGLKKLEADNEKLNNTEAQLEDRYLNGYYDENPEVYERLKLLYKTRRQSIRERQDQVLAEMAQLGREQQAFDSYKYLRDKFLDRLLAQYEREYPDGIKWTKEQLKDPLARSLRQIDEEADAWIEKQKQKPGYVPPEPREPLTYREWQQILSALNFRLYIHNERTAKDVIDRIGVWTQWGRQKSGGKDELDSLVEPIYFLDFETVNWAVPKHDGMKAYRQMPFQWSIHVMDGGGEPEHKEFLWDNKEDPRKALADSLLDALGDKGTIVMYSSFERTALNNLAEELPEYRDRVDAVIGRLWDLLEIFRKYYIDANFGGNNSIKNVLPVLVPGEGYGNLEIQEGGLASAMSAKMISKEGQEKEKIKNDLLEYCKQDTQAMVDIYRALLEKIE